MSRAATHRLKPQATAGQELTIEAYTYGYALSVQYATMRETVYLDTDMGPLQAHLSLTPDEARSLAKHLVQVAAQCDEHRVRRESLDDIAEQLRDENFDSRCVTFVHPDVIYCAPGQITETAKAHPGKLVIATRDEVPA